MCWWEKGRSWTTRTAKTTKAKIVKRSLGRQLRKIGIIAIILSIPIYSLFPLFSLDVLEVSADSAVDTQSDKLINFDAPVTKLDTMTLDDLNDDDFDPRKAGNSPVDTGDSSDTSDDFNPRGTPGTSNPRTGSMSTPIIKPPSLVALPQSTPARILPPPSLPPRDPSKIAAAKVQLTSNPFSAPTANDPFGMSSFSTGAAQQAKVGL